MLSPLPVGSSGFMPAGHPNVQVQDGKALSSQCLSGDRNLLNVVKSY